MQHVGHKASESVSMQQGPPRLAWAFIYRIFSLCTEQFSEHLAALFGGVGSSIYRCISR